MNKKVPLLLVSLVITISLVGCSQDENPETPEQEQNEEPQEEEEETSMEEEEENPIISLEDERNTTLEILTSSGTKSWEFEEVVLVNSNGTFDISQNFNTQDDVFVFSLTTSTGKNAGSIEWEKGNDINLNASSAETALLEFLVSSEMGPFEFIPDNGTSLTASSLGFSFELTNDERLSGTIEAGIGITLNVTLVEKENQSDAIPTGTLNFTDVFSFQSNGIDNQSPDMIGSLLSNSLYIALREDDLNVPNGLENPERVVRFNFNTNSVEDRVYSLSTKSDFVSKELVIHKNELKVIGAQRTNIYDLELDNEPSSIADYRDSSPYGSNTFFTRYGTAIVDNSVFIVGGYLGNDFEFADRMFKLDLETETISDFFTLPEPSLGARSEIVGSKLYTFGGSTAFYSPQARSSISIFDIVSQELSFSQMSRPVNFTYTGRQGNLIYVGGRVDTYNEMQVLVDRDPFLGVYNTETNEFTELQTNLSSPNRETIHAMTVFNNKVYLLFGDRGEIERPQMVEWTVMAADIP